MCEQLFDQAVSLAAVLRDEARDLRESGKLPESTIRRHERLARRAERRANRRARAYLFSPAA